MKRILASAILMTLTATGALAKDKMDKVDIARDGIDMRKVVVRASGQAYKLDSPSTYQFDVRGYAAAKKGYRIVSAWFFSGLPLKMSYEQGLLPRDYGSGNNRTVKRPFLFKVPMNKVTWDGPSPLEVCNNNLAKLKQAGFSQQEILGKTYELKAVAIIGFGAAADREGRTASPVGLGGGSTYEHKTLKYQVHVECRPN